MSSERLASSRDHWAIGRPPATPILGANRASHRPFGYRSTFGANPEASLPTLLASVDREIHERVVVVHCLCAAAVVE